MKVFNLAVLFVGVARAVIEFISPSCGAIDTFSINSAIDEAIAVATEANNKLLSFDPFANSLLDPRVAIYNPLFNPGDAQAIIRYLSSIVNIKNAGYNVRIYCGDESSRIMRVKDPNSNNQVWMDTDFYHNAQPNQKRGFRVGSLPSNKPIGSWTKHGWKVHDNFDSSNQAHVQLAKETIDGVRPNTDNREFAEVRSSGLQTGANFNNLDFIRPLSRTVLHEFFHVVGGLDANNLPVVVDVPNTNSNPPIAYGSFNDCMLQKNAPIPSVRQAECLTMLAVGLYLGQIQGKPAYWSLGVIDPVTLRPVPPNAAGSAKVKARAKTPFGVRGSHWR